MKYLRCQHENRLEGDLRAGRFGAPAIQSALTRADLAAVLSELGRLAEAIGHAEATVQIAQAADHPPGNEGPQIPTRPNDPRSLAL